MQAHHLLRVQAKPVVKMHHGGKKHNRPTPQHLVINNDWQLTNAHNAGRLHTIPNNEGGASNCNGEESSNNGNHGYPRMCHNDGLCPSGNPCPNISATAAEPTERSPERVDHEDPQAEGFANTLEDEHIKNILEHARLHRDGIMQRQSNNSDINRFEIFIKRIK